MKDLFELDPNITYLNCANMSPLLKSVKEAGKAGLEKRATPWKLTPEGWFSEAEMARSLAAEIFQTSSHNLAFVPSVSYGLATAAKNISVKARKNIVLLEKQFPSNFYIWQDLGREAGLNIVHVKRHPEITLTECVLNEINDNTAIIAIPNCHWIDGACIDLEKISRQAKTVNAFLILDLSQSLGARPTNIEKIDPDLAVTVGYKWMLGPYGLGYMYVAPRWHQKWKPLELSWLTRDKSHDFSTLTNYTTEYQPGARKFDMGEFPQFSTMPMAIAALKQILVWEIDNIHKTLINLTNIVEAYLQTTSTHAKTSLPTASHIISIPLPGSQTESLKKKIQNEQIVVSYRDNTMRVSPYLYNDAADIDKLIACL